MRDCLKCGKGVIFDDGSCSEETCELNMYYNDDEYYEGGENE